MDARRWLIVVQRNQQELYEILRQRFERTAVVVILDRRLAERRRGGTGQGGERRRLDRRQRRSIAWFYDALPTDSYEMAQRVATLPSAPVPAVELRTCPECAMLFEFDMPRFPQQPARLESHVVHVPQQSLPAEHYLEIQAFTVSGRPLLAHRSKGRRPVKGP